MGIEILLKWATSFQNAPQINSGQHGPDDTSPHPVRIMHYCWGAWNPWGGANDCKVMQCSEYQSMMGFNEPANPTHT